MKRIKFLRTLRHLIKDYGSENIIYIDESGFKAHCGRRDGWAMRGEKIFCDVPGKRGKTTNLIMAQKGKGKGAPWLAPMLFEQSCTMHTVNAWIENALLKELDQPSVIVMDNAPFHNKTKIKALLEEQGHTFLPLPPYSPDLNPIENTFGAIKKRREAMPENTSIDNLILSYSY